MTWWILFNILSFEHTQIQKKYPGWIIPNYILTIRADNIFLHSIFSSGIEKKSASRRGREKYFQNSGRLKLFLNFTNTEDWGCNSSHKKQIVWKHGPNRPFYTLMLRTKLY